MNSDLLARQAAAHRRPLLTVAVLLSALSLAPARALCAETITMPADPLAGRQVFLEKRCQQCHAIWGEGGSLGPDLGKGGVWHSIMQLAGVLWNHSPEMIEKMRERHIPRPAISTEEMADLAAFLYFLNYFDPPGDPDRGKALYSKKSCVSCHSVGGEGAKVGPPLDRYERFASPLFLAHAMWSHSSAMGQHMGAQHVRRPEFGRHDLAHIFAYIQSASTEDSVEKTYMVPGSPQRGEKVFADKGCLTCHAVRGAGGSVGPDLGTKRLHRSVTQIAGLMWNHEPAMRARMQEMGVPVPRFSDQEISDLIAYLFFLQYFDAPGDIVKGQGVYMDKGCVLCHYAPRGADKLLAPDLADSTVLSSPFELSSAMWNHAPVMEAQIRERGLPWPRFRRDEVRDLVEYLRSLSDAEP